MRNFKKNYVKNMHNKTQQNRSLIFKVNKKKVCYE